MCVCERLHLVKLSQLLAALRTDRQSDLMCVRDPDHAVLLHNSNDPVIQQQQQP